MRQHIDQSADRSDDQASNRKRPRGTRDRFRIRRCGASDRQPCAKGEARLELSRAIFQPAAGKWCHEEQLSIQLATQSMATGDVIFYTPAARHPESHQHG
jgi:hypothetical protein